MLRDLVYHYGYLAIFIGTFLEGETILALGGFAAHQGILQLPFVMLAAFCGSLLGDQLFFFIGRIYGNRILKKWPAWVAKKDRFDRFFKKYETPSILIFRFLYGLRNIAPFAIGMSSVRTSKFISLNVFGAFIWAIGLGYLGYLFGDGIELFLDEVRHFELFIFIGIGFLLITYSLWRAFRKR